MHLHYNWDQEKVVSPAEVLEHLAENNVVLAVRSSTPPELALSLRQAGGDWVLPLYSPYREPRGWSTWLTDGSLPARTRRALASGEYFGARTKKANEALRPTVGFPALAPRST